MRIPTSLPTSLSTSFTLLVFLLANACEPSPYPLDLDELVARWGATRANFIERCITPHTLHGSYGRAAEPTLASMAPPPESRIEIEAAFRDEFFVPDRQLDRDAFERCLSGHDELPACPVDPLAFFARAGCAQLFVGAREEGVTCGVDAVCAPGLFCDAPELQCGRCAPDLAAVEPFRPCDDDPMCGLSIAPDEIGAACDVNCGSGFFPALACIDGQCVQRRVIDIGGACDSIQENLWEPRSVRHCRDQNFGSAICMSVDGGEPECVAAVRGEGPGVFIPGAAVVSAVAGNGAVNGGVVSNVDCAP